jgi:hypothetical protein
MTPFLAESPFVAVGRSTIGERDFVPLEVGLTVEDPNLLDPDAIGALRLAHKLLLGDLAGGPADHLQAQARVHRHLVLERASEGSRR